MISKLRKLKSFIKSRLPQGDLPVIVKPASDGKYTATHISAFGHGNAGDTLLPVVLRSLFHQMLGVKRWHGYHVVRRINGRDVNRINHDDMIVIGGGGLFLCDTNRNNLSGWQWSCSIERLKDIHSPIIAFAIGYNRFRGQEDFAPVFTEHLNLFVDKAVFVGIRNLGSINALKGYLHSDELKQKLTYQPCMTTLIAKIYPYFTDYDQKDDFVAFNCAFDRQSLRSADDSYLRSIAEVALEFSKTTRVKYYSHMMSDLQALPYFDAAGVEYEVVVMNDVREMVLAYSRPKLVIGMRGHAQMIPFGCQTPILSVITHDKMQWFLDDIHHPEWGVDVSDAGFRRKLQEKALHMYDDCKSLRAEIKIQQQRLWDITMDNMRAIKKSLEAKEITPPGRPRTPF